MNVQKEISFPMPFTRILNGFLTLLMILPAPGLVSAQNFERPPVPVVAVPEAPRLDLGFLDGLDVSPQAGRIREVFVPETVSAEKLVFVVADAHGNPKAQRGIEAMLEPLLTESETVLVGVEGALGPVNFTPFDGIALEKRREFVEANLDSGLLTGTEALGILKGEERNFSVFGLEDKKTYLQNFLALRETFREQKEAERFMGRLRKQLGKLKQSVYSAELLAWDAEKTAFDEGHLERKKYVLDLAKAFPAAMATDSPFPNFREVAETAKAEQEIDFVKVQEEQKGFWERAATELPKDRYEALSSEEKAFREQKSSASRHYYVLGGALAEFGMQEAFPNLTRYTDLQERFQWVRSERVMGEIDGVTQSAGLSLCKNDDERWLVHVDQMALVLEKMSGLRITREEWAFYQENSSVWRVQNILDAARTKAEGKSSWPKDLEQEPFSLNYALASAAEYYRDLFVRDRILTESLLERMDLLDQDRAVLVAGGFHTEGITQILREKGIAFVVLSPVVEEASDLYFKVMMDGGVDVEGALGALSAAESGLARVLLLDTGLGLNSAESLKKMVAQLDERAVEKISMEEASRQLHLETLSISEKDTLAASIRKTLETQEALATGTKTFLSDLLGRVESKRNATLDREFDALVNRGKSAEAFALLKTAIQKEYDNREWFQAYAIYQKAERFKATLDPLVSANLTLAFPDLQEKIRQFQAQASRDFELTLDATKLNLINTGGHYHLAFPWRGKSIDVNVPGDGSCFYHAVAWGEVMNQLKAPESLSTLQDLDQWMQRTVLAKEAEVNLRVQAIRKEVTEYMQRERVTHKARILGAIAQEVGYMRQMNLHLDASRSPRDFHVPTESLGGDNAYSRLYKDFFTKNRDQGILKSLDQGFTGAKLLELLSADEQDAWVNAYLAAMKDTNMWAGTLEEEAVNAIRVQAARVDESQMPLPEINVHLLFHGVEAPGLVSRSIDGLKRTTSSRGTESEALSEMLSSVTGTSFDISKWKPTAKLGQKRDYAEIEEGSVALDQPGRKRLERSEEVLSEANAHKRRIAELESVREESLDSELLKIDKAGGVGEPNLEQVFHSRNGILNKHPLLFRELLADGGKSAAVLAFLNHETDSFERVTEEQLAEKFGVSAFRTIQNLEPSLQREALKEVAKQLNLSLDIQAAIANADTFTVSDVQRLYVILLKSLNLEREGSESEQAEDLKFLAAKNMADFQTQAATKKATSKEFITAVSTVLQTQGPFKSTLLMEALKRQQEAAAQKRSEIRVTVSDLSARNLQLEALSLREQKLIKTLFPSAKPVDLTSLDGRTWDLNQRLRKHNYLKWNLSEDFRETLSEESRLQVEYLRAMHAAIQQAFVKAATPLPEELKNAPLDYAQLSKWMNMSGKTGELATQAVTVFLSAKAQELRVAMRKGTRQEADDVLIQDKRKEAEALAAVNAAVSLGLGYPSLTSQQMMAALGAFRGGKVLELATGEGKTEVSMVVGFLNGLSGKGSLIITTKDNSAEDTYKRGLKPFEYLGMTLGVVKKASGPEAAAIIEANRKAYAADVTVVSTTQFHFDAQEDLLIKKSTDKERNFERPLSQYAMVVDEFDSVMIHQAQTEYIRSNSGGLGEPKFKNTEFEYDWAQVFEKDKKKASVIPAALKEKIVKGELTTQQMKYVLAFAVEKQLDLRNRMGDFGVTKTGEEYQISDKGLDAILKTLGVKGKVLGITTRKNMQNLMSREEWKRFLTGQMEAYGNYRKGVDYDVSLTGEVQLIDYGTGAFQPGVRLTGKPSGGGGHIALELIEGLSIGQDSITTASLSARDALLLVGKASGITGTANQTLEGTAKLYGMGYQHIPTQSPLLRKDVGLRGNTLDGGRLPVFQTQAARMDYLVASLIEDLKQGRPALVFANSNLDSERIRKELFDRLTVELKKPEVLEAFRRMGRLTESGKPKINLYNSMDGEDKAAEDRIVEHEAGLPGAITIVTNIGGRGTDFKLHGSAKLLGYHNYGMSPSDGSDIEAQRRGRSGRQGAMGLSEELVALDEDKAFLMKGLLSTGTEEDRLLLTTLLDDLKDKDLSADTALQSRVWQAVQRAQENLTKGKEQAILSQVKMAEFKFAEQVKYGKFRERVYAQIEGPLTTRSPPKTVTSKVEEIVKQAKASGGKTSVAELVRQTFGFEADIPSYTESEFNKRLAQNIALRLAQLQWEETVSQAQGEWFADLYAKRTAARGVSSENLADSLTRDEQNLLQKMLFQRAEEMLKNEERFNSFTKSYLRQVQDLDKQRKEQERESDPLSAYELWVERVETTKLSGDIGRLKRVYGKALQAFKEAEAKVQSLKDKNQDATAAEKTVATAKAKMELAVKDVNLEKSDVELYATSSGTRSSGAESHVLVQTAEERLRALGKKTVVSSETARLSTASETVTESGKTEKEIQQILKDLKIDKMSAVQGLNKERLREALAKAYARKHVLKLYDQLLSPQQLVEFQSMDAHDRAALLWVLFETKSDKDENRWKSENREWMAVAAALTGPEQDKMKSVFDALAKVNQRPKLEDRIKTKFSAEEGKFGGGRAGYLLSILQNGKPSNEGQFAMYAGIYNDTHQSSTELLKFSEKNLSAQELHAFLQNADVRAALKKHGMLQVLTALSQKKLWDDAKAAAAKDPTLGAEQRFYLSQNFYKGQFQMADSSLSFDQQMDHYRKQIKDQRKEIAKWVYTLDGAEKKKMKAMLKDLKAVDKNLKGWAKTAPADEHQKSLIQNSLARTFGEYNQTVLKLSKDSVLNALNADLKKSGVKYLSDNAFVRGKARADQIDRFMADRLGVELLRHYTTTAKMRGVRKVDFESFDRNFQALLENDTQGIFKTLLSEETSALRQYLDRYAGKTFVLGLGSAERNYLIRMADVHQEKNKSLKTMKEFEAKLVLEKGRLGVAKWFTRNFQADAKAQELRALIKSLDNPQDALVEWAFAKGNITETEKNEWMQNRKMDIKLFETKVYGPMEETIRGSYLMSRKFKTIFQYGNAPTRYYQRLLDIQNRGSARRAVTRYGRDVLDQIADMAREPREMALLRNDPELLQKLRSGMNDEHWKNILALLDITDVRINSMSSISNKVLSSAEVDAMVTQFSNHQKSPKFFAARILAEQNKILPSEQALWQLAFSAQQSAREVATRKAEETKKAPGTLEYTAAYDKALKEFLTGVTGSLGVLDPARALKFNASDAAKALNSGTISFHKMMEMSKGKMLGVRSTLQTDKALLTKTIRELENPQMILEELSNWNDLVALKQEREALVAKGKNPAEVDAKIRKFQLVMNADTARILEKILTKNARLEVEAAIYTRLANIMKNDANLRTQFKQVFDYDDLQMNYVVERLLVTSQIKQERLMQDSVALQAFNNRAQLRELAKNDLLFELRKAELLFQNYKKGDDKTATGLALQNSLQTLSAARSQLEFAQQRYRAKLSEWITMLTIGIAVVFLILSTAISMGALSAASLGILFAFAVGMAAAQELVKLSVQLYLGSLEGSVTEFVMNFAFQLVAATAAQLVGWGLLSLAPSASAIPLQLKVIAGASRVATSVATAQLLQKMFLPKSQVQQQISKSTSVDPLSYLESKELPEELRQALKDLRTLAAQNHEEAQEAMFQKSLPLLRIEIARLTAENEESEKAKASLKKKTYEKSELQKKLEAFQKQLTTDVADRKQYENLLYAYKRSLKEDPTALGNFNDITTGAKTTVDADPSLDADRKKIATAKANLEAFQTFRTLLQGQEAFLFQLAQQMKEIDSLSLDGELKTKKEAFEKQFTLAINAAIQEKFKKIQEKTAQKLSLDEADFMKFWKATLEKINVEEESELEEEQEVSATLISTVVSPILAAPKVKQAELVRVRIDEEEAEHEEEQDPSGTLRPTGKHDSKAYLQELEALKAKQAEFLRVRDSSAPLSTFLNRIVIEADFGDASSVPAYNFPGKSGEHIIVLNTNRALAARLGADTLMAIRAEALDHETVEVEWMDKVMAAFKDPAKAHRWSHIISSAHQVVKHGKNGKVTPYHELDLQNKTSSEIEALIREYETEGRAAQHEAIQWAISQGAVLRIEDVKAYEAIFIQRAKEILFKKLNPEALAPATSALNADSAKFLQAYRIARQLKSETPSLDVDAFALKTYRLLASDTRGDTLGTLRAFQEGQMNLSLLDALTRAIEKANVEKSAVALTPENIDGLYKALSALGVGAPTAENFIVFEKLLQTLGLQSYETAPLMASIRELLLARSATEKETGELGDALKVLFGFLGNRLLEGSYALREDRVRIIDRIADAIALPLASQADKQTALKKQIQAALSDTEPFLKMLNQKGLSLETQALLTQMNAQKTEMSKLKVFLQTESQTELVLNPKATLVRQDRVVKLKLTTPSGDVFLDPAALELKGQTLRQFFALQGAMKAETETAALGKQLRLQTDALLSSPDWKSGERKSLIQVQPSMSDAEVRQVVAHMKRLQKAGATEHNKLLGDAEAFSARAKTLGLLNESFTAETLQGLFLVGEIPAFTAGKSLILIGRTGLENYRALPKTVILDSSASLQTSLVGLIAFATKNTALIDTVQKSLSAENPALATLKARIDDSVLSLLTVAEPLVMPLIKPLLESMLANLSDEEETILIAG